MKIEITEYPTDNDWLEVKKRALVTIGKKLKTPPDAEWKRAILKARHSPIRRLRFSFTLKGFLLMLLLILQDTFMHSRI